MSGRITVVGSANVDFVMRLPHLPAKGESVTGGPFVQAFGGKGSNQALAARRSGGGVAAVFALGGDGYGGRLLEIYREEGLDTSRVTVHPGHSCGTGIILVDANGDNCIATALGANELLSAELVDAAEDLIGGSAIVMLQMESPDAAIRRAIDLAAKHGVEVMLNFAPARPSAVVLDASVTYLVVNETEAEGLTGIAVDTIAGADAAARKLAGNGHRTIIVPLGANGCLAFETGAASHYPAFAVEAIDATAAGDSFCGALAAAMAEGFPFAEAVRFASAAGAICASRMGAMPSIPVREDILGFLRGR
jgi:ribokinase